MTKLKDVSGGLLPTPIDKRDFSLGGVFGDGKIEDVPLEDWSVGTTYLKDQAVTVPDGCTGFSLAAVLEDHEGVELDPGFMFAMIKRQMGSWKPWGGDLRAGCKVATSIGALEVGQNPSDFSGKGRDFIANWANWALDLLLPRASKHAQASFFKVDGPYDTFDNIRAALWAHKGEQSAIYTGVVWRPGWLYAPSGIIPTGAIAGGTGHAIKIRPGQKIIKGQPHLIVQNSYGNDVGDGGFHYFSREVVNREFTFGEYMFKDMPPEQAISILKGKGLYTDNRNWWAKLVSWLSSFQK